MPHFLDIKAGGMNTRRVVDIDREIMLIQQSTRTLFRVFFPVHDWLRLHSTYYYLWSMKPYSRVVHWVALFLFICSLPAFYFSAFQIPGPAIAASHTCTFTGAIDTAWNKAGNWDSGCNGGTEFPGQDSAKSYDVIIPTGQSVVLDTGHSINNIDNSALGNIDITGTLTTNNNNLTFGSITINNGGIVTSGSSTLTTYGDWTYNNGATFNYDSSLVVFAGNGKNLAGSAATIRFNNLTINTGASLTTAGSLSAVTVSGTTMTVNGSLIIGSSDTVDFSNSVQTLLIGASGLINGTDVTNSIFKMTTDVTPVITMANPATGNFGPNLYLQFYSSNTVSTYIVPSLNYKAGKVEVWGATGSGLTVTASIAAGTLDVDGDFIIKCTTGAPGASNFNLSNSNNTTINIGGNFIRTEASSSTAKYTKGASDTIIFDGTGTQTFDPGASSAFKNITHSGTSTLQLTNTALSVSGSFTNSAGTVYTNGLAFSVAGTFDNNNGTLKLNGDESMTLTNDSFHGTVEYIGTVGPYDLKNMNYNNLIINGGPAVTFRLYAQATTGVNGNLNIASGILDTKDSGGVDRNLYLSGISSSVTIAGTLIANSSAITMDGNWTNSGVFDAGTSTVNFFPGGTSTLVSGGTGNNNDFNIITLGNGHVLKPQTNGLKAVTVTCTWGTLDMTTYDQTLEVSGTLSVAGQGIYLPGTGTQTISTLTNDGTVTAENCPDVTLHIGTPLGSHAISYPSSCEVPVQDTCKLHGPYTNLTLNTNNGCNVYELEDTTTVTGTLTTTGVTLAIGTQTLNISGDISVGYNIIIGTGTLNVNGTLTGGSSIVCNGASHINVGGSWMVSSFTPSNSTVTFNGTSPVGLANNYTWYNLAIADLAGVNIIGQQTVTNNLVVSSGQLDLQYMNEWNMFNHQFKNVSIEAGGSIKQGDQVNMSVSGNWSNFGTFTPSTGAFNFNGTGDSTISGSTNFRNLTMDASADGAKTIYFADGKGNTTTVNGAWSIKGSLGNYLTLRSTNHNLPWYFNIPADMTSGNYIDVEDSHSINDFRITPGSHVINSGNNAGWNFPTGAIAPTTVATITTPEESNTPEPSAIASLVDTLQNNPVAQAIANVAEKVTQVTAAIGLIPLVANLIGGIPAALHAVNYGFSLTIEALGIRRRRKSWGRVYDSTTGKGIDTAVIRLYDQEDMTLKGTMITDLKGKYYFSADPGVYAITVSKDGYIFPTEIFAKYGIQSFNKKASRDNTQYVGQPINIDDKTNYLNIDVPMDPVKPNISTMLKIKIFGKDLFNYFLIGLPYIVIPALIIGSVLSIFTAVVRPTNYNIILSVVYVALTTIYILSRYLRFAHAGMVLDKTDKKPIQGVMISLFEKEHNNLKETRITDRYGRFSINAPKGHYYLKAQKTGYAFTISGKEDKDINLKESSYVRENIEGEKK